MSRDDKIVDFPKVEITPEERARRLTAEVNRLASLPPTEWMFWLDGVADTHGVKSADLRAMIEATIQDREKKARADKVEDRQREQRAEKRQTTARREEERKRREHKRAQDEQRREQERSDKEAERKREKREKAFATIAKLPRLAHEARLAELAKRLGEDRDFLRDEFAVFVGPESTGTGYIEPWPEPVETAVLLTELLAQLRRYVVIQDDAAVAVTLWVCFAWLHEMATHSPLLVIRSAEPDTGKTTTLGVLGFLTPRPYSAVELTGANIYRIVDHLHPTLLIDEADQLFHRKPALAEVVNAGWTKGTKIPRMVRGGEIHQFDPFCAKAIGLIGLNLPSHTSSRAIVIKLVPKLPDEKISDFRHVDDDNFVTLRRKLTRWAVDNAAALRDANPVLPLGFGNRLAMNWRLQLAIADLAGGTWAKRARAAAVKLSHKRHRPSEGLRLLAALRPMFAGHEALPSGEIVTQLAADPVGEWCGFRNRRPITQRQLAALLSDYDIHPVVLHPTKRANLSRHGYRRSQFADPWARFLPRDPNIRTPTRRKPREPKGTG